MKLILCLFIFCFFTSLKVDAKTSTATTVVILIDGLGWDQYELMMEAKKLPQIRYFFGPLLSQNTRQGQASFPSLTFNNISAILTGLNMDSNPIKGNKNILEDHVVNFESPFSSEILKNLVRPQSLFQSSTHGKEENWAFSYSFRFSDHINLKPNVKTGFQYLSDNYPAIDQELIELAIEKMKKNTQWPRFVFIHLIGLDALNHLKGPSSKESLQYLPELDRKLKPLFNLLQVEQNKRLVGTLLLADHGFTQIKNNYLIENEISQHIPDDKKKPLYINESRFFGIYFHETWNISDRIKLLTTSTQSPMVLGWALQQDDYLTISLQQKIEKFRLIKSVRCKNNHDELEFTNGVTPAVRFCPEDIDKLRSPKNTVSFYENLVSYFTNHQGPQALIFAQEGISFQNKYKGEHGGMTEQEMLTPFLMHNLHIDGDRNSPIPTYKTLQLLKLR